MNSHRKKTLLILGAGGHGRVLADAAEASGQWDPIVFLDDRFPEMASSACWPVIGKVADAAQWRDAFPDAAVGVGNNATRIALFEQLRTLGFGLPVIAHPSASISRQATIGEGSVVFAQAAVNIGSSVGAACIINTGAKIDHDCMLGSGVHVSPGASVAGAVVIGDGSWIGIGASVKQEVVIGANVTVGAGAAVLGNLSDGVIAMGVPARSREHQG